MFEEVEPNLSALRGVEVVVRQEQFDAGLEGVVDGREAVDGQEQDALIVFELGEKDCGLHR